MPQSIAPVKVPHLHNPIHTAAMQRGILCSSAISGIDPATNEYPTDQNVQVAVAFQHLQAILADAGAQASDVVKLVVYVNEQTDRSLVNTHWLRFFPGEHERPAWRTHKAKLPPGCYLQLEIQAVV